MKELKNRLFDVRTQLIPMGDWQKVASFFPREKSCIYERENQCLDKHETIFIGENTNTFHTFPPKSHIRQMLSYEERK